MQTDHLIRAIASDTRRSGPPPRAVWIAAAAVAAVLAAAVFLALLGPRHDIAEAVRTVRFPFKFVVTLALASAAYGFLQALSRPAADTRAGALGLAAAPLLLIIAVAAELVAVPPDLWATRLVGTNWLLCLMSIPAIGIAPLAAFLLALRHCAPTRPALSGAVAGVLAGGVAATFYAAHCPDDSPLFVATWYTIAIAGLALVGALVAPRVTRW